MIHRLTLLLPRALLLMLESWLATISTLLAVMGIQVELSSPDRQLQIALRTIKVTIYQVHDNIGIEMLLHSERMFQITWQSSPSHCRFREGTYIIWVSCKLLMSVEVGLVDCDMAECSGFVRRPVPNNPFSSSLKDGIFWPSLACASKRQKKGNILIWTKIAL